MIPTPKPARIMPLLEWRGRHLYEVWPARILYTGSILREAAKRTWAAWGRGGEYIASFQDESDARNALEAYAREREES